VLAAGTLNIHVKRSGFPAAFLDNFKDHSFRHLDLRRFKPEAELPWSDIGGNTLPPTPDKPDRGSAQVWRASLLNLQTKNDHLCWVLRRIGSDLRSEVELVSDENLREALNLSDGSPVQIGVEGAWVET